MRFFFRLFCAGLAVLAAAILTVPGGANRAAGQTVLQFAGRLLSDFQDHLPWQSEAVNGSGPATLRTAASAAAQAPRKVAAGGELIGIRLQTKGVLVVGTDSFETENGMAAPAQEAGIRTGDVLLSVNGEEIRSNLQLTACIEQSGGAPLTVMLRRQDREMAVTLQPQKTSATGSYKGGLWIRDAAAGIGTLTFTDPATGSIAALGHGICDGDTSALMPVSGGQLYTAELLDITKGTVGAAGEISGRISEFTLGEVSVNCDEGIYGTVSAVREPQTLFTVAKAEEVRTGSAQILCTVTDGGKQYYDIDITKVGGNPDKNKSLTIRVTDPTLLEITGGIVQGMSGSPIFQDGKLVAALTHVLVNDPKSGYAIFAETMLQDADTVAARENG